MVSKEEAMFLSADEAQRRFLGMVKRRAEKDGCSAHTALKVLQKEEPFLHGRAARMNLDEIEAPKAPRPIPSADSDPANLTQEQASDLFLNLVGTHAELKGISKGQALREMSAKHPKLRARMACHEESELRAV